MAKDEYLNINMICDRGTKVLGPGLRYAIWTQGCVFNCPKCTSPDTKPINPNILIPINDIIKSIADNDKIEGITISGGEPFLQASKILLLLERIRVIRPLLNIIIYTGFNIEELDWNEAKEVIALSDVVIDGRYIEEYNDNKGIRGSSNQRVNYISERLIKYKDDIESGKRNFEVYVSDSQMNILGIPTK